ncbi:HAD family phosphatase [Phormidium tenue FACHB-886]|nr:HAD family phosphatase [Phormidium tenue FACHB-886]
MQSSETVLLRQPIDSPELIRLLVLDLDGTTVGVSNEVKPTVKRAVQAAQAKGVQVAIATGRMFRSALRFHQDLGSTLPLMTYQGALIKEPATGIIQRHLTVPQALAIELLDYLEQSDLQQQLSIHCYKDDRLYVRKLTEESVEYAERSEVEPTPVGDLRLLVQQGEPTKLLALSQNIELIDQLWRSLSQRYEPEQLYFTKSVPTFLEATHPLANKGTAVHYLAEALGLSSENVMAIGDNYNDLEMIEYAGVGVAMGTAPDAVKAAATWVAPDVESDGVAAAIEQFILSAD